MGDQNPFKSLAISPPAFVDKRISRYSIDMATTYLPRCGEYALRAMAYLAADGGRTAVARDIAAATMVPVNYLQKILSQLARAQLLRAQRGLGGGFTLGRPSTEISMHEIFKAVDSQVERITRCPLGLPGHVKLCPMHQKLDQTYALIDEVFRTTTLSSLVESAGDEPHPLTDGECTLGSFAVAVRREIRGAVRDAVRDATPPAE